MTPTSPRGSDLDDLFFFTGLTGLAGSLASVPHRSAGRMTSGAPVDGAALHARLERCVAPLGGERRALVLGEWTVDLVGLDAGLAAELDRRWGPFLLPEPDGNPRAVVRFVAGGDDNWLPSSSEVEVYRLEALNAPAERIVASYHFAIGREAAAGEWRVAISRSAREPVGRIAENAVRFVVATLAAAGGGFAMHAAAVLRDGRAWLFAGPSRAGKSTAVRLSEPAVSLGDDYGLVVPVDGTWVAPAVPFDNAEKAPEGTPRGWVPVAGIWRLHQATEARVEVPPGALAVASLMSCVAFPWTMPEDSDRLLEQAGRFVREARFGHLHFARSPDFWTHLVAAAGDRD